MVYRYSSFFQEISRAVITSNLPPMGAAGGQLGGSDKRPPKGKKEKRKRDLQSMTSISAHIEMTIDGS
mgnify:CR=1 FL=1